MPTGALGAAGIMAGADIASTALGMSASSAANSQNATDAYWNLAQQQSEYNQNTAIAQSEFNKNVQMQYDFAQNGLSWRIADAAKNGISPLAAIGASGPSYSPVASVMTQTQPYQSPQYNSPLNAASAGVKDLGQDVSRALSATRTPEQQMSDQLDLAYKSKQNDLLDVQILSAKRALNTPTPGIDLSWNPVKNIDGTVSNVPTHGGEFLGPLMWSYHNKLVPVLNDAYQGLSHGIQVQQDWGGHP